VRLVAKYKIEILIGLIILGLFLLTRLPNLTLLPIFADEAIYIRWAQVMRAEPTLRFLPLSDGKTPLFMWILMPMFKVISDPLFAGRLLSVIAGFFTLLGIFALSYKVFGKKVAFWSALIYAVVPYMVFFDRMALVDSMLASITIWAIFFAVWLVESRRFDVAMVLGYLLGAGILTKPPGFMNLLALPITIIGINLKNRRSIPKLFVCWLIALIITAVMYGILKLGPGFQQLTSRSSDYTFSPLDLIHRPLDPFLPHLGDMADWFPKLLTWPILVAIFIGIFFVIIKRNRFGVAVLIWTLVPMLLQMFLLKTFTARYLLFSIPPLLVLGGYGVSRAVDLLNGWSVLRVLKERKQLVFLAIVPLLVGASLHFDYLLITKPELAPLPIEERRGYLEDWTAGYNFKEIANFLLDKQKEGPVLVGTEGYFGTLPDGLQIYLDKSSIPVVGSSSTVSANLREAAEKNQTYFVGNRNRLPEHIDDVKLINVYLKAKPLDNRPQDAIVVYQVFP
jgi:4-amino-4-deoxy-L-arabinose transferase-like glycosyltransferase